MNIRLATEDEINNWDDLVVNNPDGGNAFQGKDFALVKLKYGANIKFLIADEPQIAFTVIEKYLVGFGRVWYLPKGPGIKDAQQLNYFAIAIENFARSSGIVNVKVEPDLLKKVGGTDSSLMKSTGAIQPNLATVWISLKGTLDEIKKSLPQRGRRAIKQAEKAGINVELVDCTRENSKKMYELYKETALDAGFADRGEEYYLDFYEQFAKTDHGKLFFAYHEEKLLAGAFVIVYGKKAIYKDGGSKRSKSINGVGHLLHWRIIEWLHGCGVTDYDFFGAPPADQINNKSHPFYGIGIFKTSFNKEVTEYIGAFNIPIGLRGKIWHAFLEKIIRKIYFVVKKQSFY